MMEVCLRHAGLVLWLAGLAWAQGMGPDAPADPAPQPECSSYTISIGIYTKFFYTCCGQMEEATPPLVNEEPVQNWDCNPREITYADVNVTQRFDCNGDAGASAIRGLCNARWGWIAADDCWKWPACFEGACQQETIQPGSASLADGFCGDGRCDGGEDTNSCPADCCPLANPDACLVRNNTCPDSCCTESTCCANTSVIAGYFWAIVFGVLGGAALLIVLCCCCCCCCIYRHCRSSSSKCEKSGCNHPSKVDRQDTTMTVLSMK